MKITEAAIKEFKNTLDDNGAKNSGIRIALSAGCCGPLFGLEVVEKGKSGDKIIVQDGINFFLSPDAEKPLENAVLDFSEDSFVFKGSPLEKSSCC